MDCNNVIELLELYKVLVEWGVEDIKAKRTALDLVYPNFTGGPFSIFPHPERAQVEPQLVFSTDSGC